MTQRKTYHGHESGHESGHGHHADRRLQRCVCVCVCLFDLDCIAIANELRLLKKSIAHGISRSVASTLPKTSHLEARGRSISCSVASTLLKTSSQLKARGRSVSYSVANTLLELGRTQGLTKKAPGFCFFFFLGFVLVLVLQRRPRKSAKNIGLVPICWPSK
jgi:hypothetical protein